MRAVRSVAGIGCGLVALFAIGCGQSPEQQQIEALQLDVNDLTAENQDLKGQLMRAYSDRDEARGRARSLEDELARLQAELAEQEKTARQEGRWTIGEGGIAWTDIADNILFDSGKANLKPKGRTELQTVVAEIREKFSGRQIWIIGHTDSDPIKHSKWKDNLELSVQRAATVFRAMQALGMSPREMVAAGQGEHNPKAANQAKTKHRNRRVQIIAVEIPDTTRGIEETSEQG